MSSKLSSPELPFRFTFAVIEVLWLLEIQMFRYVSIILLTLLSSGLLVGQRNLPSDSLAYTVNFDCGGLGSGFLLRTDTKVYLVTARHALFTEPPAPRKLRCETAGMDQHSPTSMDRRRRNWFMMDIQQLQSNVKVSDTNDVAVIEIGDVVSSAPANPIQTEFLQLYSPNSPKTAKPEWVHFANGVGLQEHVDKLLAFRLDSVEMLQQVGVGDSIYVFGYPSSIGIPQKIQLDYNMPLVRTGIVSQKNNSPRNIVLDCFAFPGNSGGPVVGVKHEKHGDKVIILGIVVQFVPVVLENALLKNSGYSIAEPMDSVLELLGK